MNPPMNETRQGRGLMIAALCKITKVKNTWIVPSQSGKGRYTMQLESDSEYTRCSCPDYETNACKCKHIFAVEFAMLREENVDGTTTVTEKVTLTATKRTTYRQNWPAYNEAQTNEKRQFQILLHDLCAAIENPKPGKGRPTIPLSDAVFAVTFKIYSTFSGRRFISDLTDAQAKGHIGKVPHFNSIFNYLENPDLTPILTELIIRSSTPLKAVEVDFAVDSTGFSTSRFVRWYDHKYGVVRQEHDWVKCHLMCGVKTNVVTSVEIHQRDAADAPILPALVEATAKNFQISEVSADKAYASVDNLNAVAKCGGTPFIAFKSNHTGASGGLWEKMFHYFQFKRSEFLTHYHKRSNVESTINMIKAKFRDHVRSKTDVAMKNEVLCKILCHNICCLISAMYELKVVPTFPVLENSK
ncbi:MAG: transposase [Verrucomicrobiales bacterium]|nr:transposase [Verrucomicrobiales bacterium]